MEHIPTNCDEMAVLVESAIAGCPGPSDAEPNIEHLAMLAAGEGDRLSEADRTLLLRQIVADPASARVVAELAGAGTPFADLAARVPRGKSRPRGRDADGRSAGRSGDAWALTWSRRLWAVAACAVIGLGAWRLADPPSRPAVPMPNPTFTLQNQRPPGGRLPTGGRAGQAPPATKPAGFFDDLTGRDWALLLAAVAWAALSVPAVWLAVRRPHPTSLR